MDDRLQPSQLPRQHGQGDQTPRRAGINAYNWIGSPQFRLDGESLQGFKNWGKGNEKMELFLKAYANPAAIDVDPTPNQVINVGFGYDAFDYNFLPTDGDRQNSSPQALYLKVLPVSLLPGRAAATGIQPTRHATQQRMWLPASWCIGTSSKARHLR